MNKISRIVSIGLIGWLVLGSIPGAQATDRAYKVAGWLPISWDIAEGRKSFEENMGLFSQINPFAYSLQEDGSLHHYNLRWDRPRFQKMVAREDILLIPTITNNYDPEKTHKVLANPTVLKKHIQTVVAEVRYKGYDGIEIDYEAVMVEDKELFTDFVVTLADQLHALGKKLSIAVQVKLSDNANWNGPGATDYEAIGRAVDYFKIMTYDQNWRNDEPGPVTSTPWIDKALRYAKRYVPAEKIYAGIPFYAYDWPKREQPEPGDEYSAAVSRTWDTLEDVLEKYEPIIRWDETAEASYFEYTSDIDKQEHLVYFPSERALAKALQMVKKHGVAGIAIWRIGKENPASWEVIAREFDEKAQLYADVADSAWFAPYVQRLAEENLLLWRGDYLSPQTPLTRRELLTMIFDWHYVDVERKWQEIAKAGRYQLFADVSAAEPGYQLAQVAAAYGIASGYEDGRFGLEDAVNREQALKMIMLASSTPLSDVYGGEYSDISEWSRPYIAGAVANKLLTPKADQKFWPHKPVSRVEGMKMLIESGQRGTLLQREMR